MADHKVGGLPELGRMDMMTTLTTLGFVGSDVDVDEDSGKAIWDDLASEIAAAAPPPWIDTPATFLYSWTLKEQSSKVVYGSCIYDQMFGLRGSQYTLAKPSSSERFYTDKFSDATGSNHLKLHRQISDNGNVESRSELNKDAIGVLLSEKSLLAKSGKQVEQCMVNDLSAHPYNPVCPLSQCVNSYSSSSQQIGSSSGEVKYIRNSDQEMQIACEIVEEQSHIALYGGKNPYELTGLGDPHDKFIAPSLFEGVNISSISSTSSGMNLSTNSAKENNEYNQLKLQKQIDGYQRGSIKSASWEKHDNFPSLRGIDNVADNNPRMSLLHNTIVSTRIAGNQSPTMSGMVHADVLEIYSSLDQQTSANNIQIQYALQAARQPSQQSLHADVAETNSPFGHHFAANIIQRQLAPQVTTQPSNISLHGSYNHNLRIGSGGDFQIELFRPFSSHITNSDVISGALPKINMQAETMVDSILITPCPLRIEAHARESYDIDTVSKATRQSCQVYFDSAEQSSQCVQEMRLDEATNSNMLTAQQQPQRQLYRHLERHHKKIVASEAQALHGNVETPIRMNKAKEFPKIVRDHEACLLSFYHPAPIPSHVMNMLHWCFGIDMERKMPLPKRYPTQCYGTPRFLLFDCRRDPAKHSHAWKTFPDALISVGGCFRQQKLQTATPEEKFMVFEEIMPHAIELVTDIYGSYVLQKVATGKSLTGTWSSFDVGEVVQGNAGVVDEWRWLGYCPQLINFLASLAIELGDLDQKIQIAKELNNDIMKCIYDQNANHVDQKCIEHVPPQFIKFFLEDMYGCVVELSVHPYGCHAVQRVPKYFDDPIQEIFLEEIIEDVYSMTKEQYANNVVQHILQHGKALVRSLIIKRFIEKVVTLSKQKLSSSSRPEAQAQPCTMSSAASTARSSQSTSRKDPAWEFALPLTGNETKNQVGCLYCKNYFKGGITRLKRHLAGVRGQSVYCTQVPDDVKEKVKAMLDAHGEKKSAKLDSQLRLRQQVNINGNDDEEMEEVGEVEVQEAPSAAGSTLVMVNDQYANYVVQKVIETCDECLRMRHRQLRNCTYAKHVVARIERLIEAGEHGMVMQPRNSRQHGKEAKLP
uniref:BED-type domain-containing protein n=1 Tax=Oryza glumipatula TaxID=40148 RepID=A0A0D9ZXH6_9ORYZ